MEELLNTLPDDKEEKEETQDYDDTGKAPYTGDETFTSFEQQLRIARERELARQKKEKMSKSASGLFNNSTASIQEKMKKFQIGTSNKKSMDDTEGSSMSSLGADNLVPDKDESSKSPEPSAEKKKTGLTIQEKLRLAKERGQSRQPKAFRGRMHCSMSVVPSALPEESNNNDDNNDDKNDSVGEPEVSQNLKESFSHAPCYTGDESFTSFDQQMAIVRQREAERKKAEMQKKLDLGGSTSSIKDRMKMFSK